MTSSNVDMVKAIIDHINSELSETKYMVASETIPGGVLIVAKGVAIAGIWINDTILQVVSFKQSNSDEVCINISEPGSENQLMRLLERLSNVKWPI